MSNKTLATGIVIGVVLTAAICYIIYLQEEKKKLSAENDFFRQRLQGEGGAKIININEVPAEVRSEFKKVVNGDMSPNAPQSFSAALKNVRHLKNVIENRGGHTLFYNKERPITKEKDLHVLYDFTWAETKCDVNKEVNNGRGPVDFKISIGLDQTLVEFKLAKDSHLKRKLQNQITIYAKANHKPKKIVGIIFTTKAQHIKVTTILNELSLSADNNIILIDARRDNKPSASKA